MFHPVLPLVAGKVTAPSSISLQKTLPPPASITGLQKPCRASHPLPPHSPQAAEAFEVKNCPRTQHFDLKWVALLQEYLTLMRSTICHLEGCSWKTERSRLGSGRETLYLWGEQLWGSPVQTGAAPGGERGVQKRMGVSPWGWERSPGEGGSEGKIF